MQFVLIPPGQMREAVFHPACPDEDDPVLTGKGTKPGIDRRVLWTQADLFRCRESAARESSDGFTVKITRPFYLAKFEVTQAEWVAVMASNPSFFKQGKVLDEANRHPVDSITWEDAQVFVQKLNEREGTAAYRLPTEFEWEFAGRAGGSGQVGWDQIRRQAVQGLRAGDDGKAPTTQAVGSKEANAWGLYDMLGNVWEWVKDYYNEKTFADPVPPTNGARHVLKGGGFLSDVKNAIYATHAAGPADKWDVGFRIAREVELQ